MKNDIKKLVPIGSVLFVLVIIAWYSLSTLPHNRKKTPEPPLLTPTQTAVEPGATDSFSLPKDSRPAGYLPTDEEILQSIEDQNKKREAREKLKEARDKKAEAVIAAVNAAPPPPDSPDVIPEDATPKRSPEEMEERNKELRDGIKVHMYFPH